MPEDLGTWSRPQAAVLVKVLRRAGCRPETTAAPGGDDILVTVPDEQADRANAAIAAEMDTIARAAREERERNVQSLDAARRKREKRAKREARTSPPSSSSTGDRPLATERLRGLAPILGLLLAVLLVAALVPPGARFLATLVAVLVVTYLVGRGRMDGGPRGG